MDEPTVDLPGQRWGHLRWLLLLVVLTVAMRAWQVSHTEVTTRDSVAYIRYAWRLHNESWLHVIRTEEHHPVYPFLIYLADGAVRALVPDDLPLAMQLTAQLISCLASVLLVVPVYFLGCELFDRRVGFWSALLLQCLPSSGRVMADGLTEPVFLLLAASSLLFACRAVRAGGVGWFALTGLASGLAYLTRTEGLLIAAVTGVVLLGLQFSKAWRRRWAALVRAGLALTVTALVVAGPFMLHVGDVSCKPMLRHFLGRPEARAPLPVEEEEQVAHAGLPLGVWLYKMGVKAEDRYLWAAYALVAMIDKGFFHVLTLPTLAGLWLFRRRAAQVPGMWVHFVLAGVLLALLYRLGQSNGYLGERHVLLLVMGGLYFAVAALAVLASWLARWLRRLSGPVLALGLLTVLAVLPLNKTLSPLHPERVGFRQAGRWLALNARPEDQVYDPFAWSSYHAGRVFQEKGIAPSLVCYVVLDRSRSKHEHLWYLVQPAEELASHGVPVQEFPVRVGKYRSTVVVYRVEPVIPANPVKKSPPSFAGLPGGLSFRY